VGWSPGLLRMTGGNYLAWHDESCQRMLNTQGSSWALPRMANGMLVCFLSDHGCWQTVNEMGSSSGTPPQHS
jgi:hypothetical protein